MFNAMHYVPILKWKAAEQRALEHLTSHEKSFMTPFFQIVMPTPSKKTKNGEEKTHSELFEEAKSMLKDRLSTIPDDIKRCWGKDPAFIDVSLVVDVPLRKIALLSLLQRSSRLGIPLIPSIGLATDVSIQKAVASYAKGHESNLCLRLTRNDFSQPAVLLQKLQVFLDTYQLSADEIHLIMDFQDYPSPNLTELCSRLPYLTNWKTLTFACGSFPKDLTEFRVGEENYAERVEWNGWSEQKKTCKLKRFPAFGDYTIQHPIHNESAQYFSPSASLRYTLRDKWLVLRGQKGRSAQYLAHARMLSQDSKFSGMYFGKEFSYGDSYIANKGIDLDDKATGNATTWLVAGINHHLACTVSQIANLT